MAWLDNMIIRCVGMICCYTMLDWYNGIYYGARETKTIFSKVIPLIREFFTHTKTKFMLPSWVTWMIGPPYSHSRLVHLRSENCTRDTINGWWFNPHLAFSLQTNASICTKRDPNSAYCFNSCLEQSALSTFYYWLNFDDKRNGELRSEEWYIY